MRSKNQYRFGPNLTLSPSEGTAESANDVFTSLFVKENCSLSKLSDKVNFIGKKFILVNEDAY